MAVEDRLLQQMSDAIRQERLSLPSLPEVALKIRELANDDEASPNALAREIAKDPAIAARLMRVANSAACRAGRTIQGLAPAIMRLGIDLTRDLVTAFALEQLYRARSAPIRDRLRASHTHSIEVAALSRVLAAHCTVLHPEMAMLAGLLHEIGVLPILRLAENDPDIAQDGAALDRVSARLHPAAGRIVLQAWQLPRDLLEVPQGCLDVTRAHEGPADYVDVVTVARLQTLAAKGKTPEGLDRATVPAFAKLDISAEMDVMQIEGVAEEYGEGQGLLSAA